ncbi:MAG: aminopeptidase N, partial [Rhodocyclaceae bacterium]|nr:aminopeptidase N [Rhodocyclaceae bacterium]
MRTEHAPTIQRADYRPLSYTVDTVDLHFRLDAEATEVRSRMLCLRNADAAAGPLVLYGDALELVSLTIDGREPAPETIRRCGGVMAIEVSGDRLEVEVVTRINL